MSKYVFKMKFIFHIYPFVHFLDYHDVMIYTNVYMLYEVCKDKGSKNHGSCIYVKELKKFNKVNCMNSNSTSGPMNSNPFTSIEFF